MKNAILAVAVLSLAACAQTSGEDAGASEAEMGESVEAGFEAVAPGSYTVSHADGAVDELTIHPGLTWSMVFADGEAAGGTIFAQGGQSCFVTEGVEEHQCFEEGEIAEDGSMTVTAEGGEAMTVTPAASTSE